MAANAAQGGIPADAISVANAAAADGRKIGSGVASCAP